MAANCTEGARRGQAPGVPSPAPGRARRARRAAPAPPRGSLLGLLLGAALADAEHAAVQPALDREPLLVVGAAGGDLVVGRPALAARLGQLLQPRLGVARLDAAGRRRRPVEQRRHDPPRRVVAAVAEDGPEHRLEGVGEQRALGRGRRSAPRRRRAAGPLRAPAPRPARRAPGRSPGAPCCGSAGPRGAAAPRRTAARRWPVRAPRRRETRDARSSRPARARWRTSDGSGRARAARPLEAIAEALLEPLQQDRRDRSSPSEPMLEVGVGHLQHHRPAVRTGIRLLGDEQLGHQRLHLLGGQAGGAS